MEKQQLTKTLWKAVFHNALVILPQCKIYSFVIILANRNLDNLL